MALEYKQFRCDMKLLSDEPKGTFEGMASVFGNVDFDGDIVMPGAFQKSLAEMATEGRKLKMLQGHRSPIGTFDVVKETDTGLFVKGRPLVDEVQLAKETSALMRDGAMDGLSIGFITRDSAEGPDGTRLLKEVDLMEVSVVTFGANPKALITDVKSMMTPSGIGELACMKDVESFLREVGMSQGQAKSLIARIKALTAHRDGEDEVSLEEVSTLLATLTASLNSE